MKSFDVQYKEIISECVTEGLLRPTRSGISSYSILGKTIEHDMSLGFPLSTLRKMPHKSMRVETEFYLKGYTDKDWLTKNGCNFWDSWKSNITDNFSDLGPTYGFEWRHWNAPYTGVGDYTGQGVDQIAWVVAQLKKDPESKRLVVSQWNASHTDIQAIPPCPFAFQLLKYGNKLNLIFYQRSADACLGLPNDFAQHALLLHLFCLEAGYVPGNIIGMFGQVELYENHVAGAKGLITREPLPYPTITTSPFTSVFDWKYGDTTFGDYISGDKITFDIAV